MSARSNVSRMPSAGTVSKRTNELELESNGQTLEAFEANNWNRYTSGMLVMSLSGGHMKTVTALALANQGDYLISAGSDRRIVVWNLETGELVQQIDSAHSQSINALCCAQTSGDSRPSADDDEIITNGSDFGDNEQSSAGSTDQFYSASEDGLIKLWDLKDYTCVRVFQGHRGAVKSLAMRRTGEIVSGGHDYTIRIWSKRESGNTHEILKGHHSAVICLMLVNTSLSADSDELLISGSLDESIRVWSMRGRVCLRKLVGHRNSVNALAMTMNGRLVSASSDKTLRVWDVSSGESLITLYGHLDSVNSLTLDSRGFVVSGSHDEMVKVWSVEEGHCLKTLTYAPGGYASLIDHKRDNHLIVTSGHRIDIWRLE